MPRCPLTTVSFLHSHGRRALPPPTRYKPHQELQLLEDGANVFKLVGPLMVKQELEEARGNVAKRLEFIAQEQ